MFPSGSLTQEKKRMIKKAAIGMVATILVGVFLFGTRFFGFVGTGVDNVRNAAQDAVPFAWQLEEAKKKVAKMDGVIEEHMYLLASLQQDISKLNTDIAEREKSMGTQLAQLGELRNLEKSASGEYVSVKSGEQKKSVPVEKVSRDINVRTASYKRNAKALETRKEMLAQKQTTYTQSKAQLDELVSVKEQMELRIKELEAKKATLATRKAAEATQFDDSDVKAAQEILDELDRGISVEANMLDLKAGASGSILEFDLNDDAANTSREELDEILHNGAGVPEELISIER
jgi:chromosome segregation ATPase